MIAAQLFVEQAKKAGFGFYTGVPCSFLKPFINYAIDDPETHYVAAANEGDAIAIAAGAELAGSRSVAMFQNSGLGNAVNPLTSLTHTCRIPILLIVTLRGDPEGAPDEPQHDLMGRITADMLDLIGIPWEYFPESADAIAAVLDRVDGHMRRERRPYALIMRKGSVEPRVLKSTPQPLPWRKQSSRALAASSSRHDMLAAVLESAGPDDALVATTGYTGRELFALQDKPSNFYMVGSMGCASSLGLGIALARPERRVIVIDGDGALIMRLGALTSIGVCQPANLVHLVVDNGLHESTGGQATASPGIDFCAIAAACGYPASMTVDNPTDLAQLLDSPSSGPVFVRVPVQPGVPDDLPRPDISPQDVAARFRGFLEVRDESSSTAS
jgi:phosphonopyruvate decarboxylase